MYQYQYLLNDILTYGDRREDRTGVGTLSLFGRHISIPVRKDMFPLITTKTIHFKSVLAELLWFISGSTNIKDLHANGVTIWDEWANEKGDLGPIYGKQWRSFANSGHDQLGALLLNLKLYPNSRRHIVTAWNPLSLPLEGIPPKNNVDIGRMALAPCHLLFQVYVSDTLSLQVYQRSADVFLGVPFNIASYALLLLMLAETLGIPPGMLHMTFGDIHLYTNHVEQAKLQLSREPRVKPEVLINPNVNSIFEYTMNDFQLLNYHPYEKIPAQIAV